MVLLKATSTGIHHWELLSLILMVHGNIVQYVLPATRVWLVISILKLSSVYSSNYFQHNWMLKRHPSRCPRPNFSGLWHPLTQHLTLRHLGPDKIPTAQLGTQASNCWKRFGLGMGWKSPQPTCPSQLVTCAEKVCLKHKLHALVLINPVCICTMPK